MVVAVIIRLLWVNLTKSLISTAAADRMVNAQRKTEGHVLLPGGSAVCSRCYSLPTVSFDRE